MAKPIKVEKWKANDGKLFDTQEEAVNYDRIMALAYRLSKEVLLDDDPDEVATWLVKNYILTDRRDLP